jgi:hypothetical protein
VDLFFTSHSLRILVLVCCAGSMWLRLEFLFLLAISIGIAARDQSKSHRNHFRSLSLKDEVTRLQKKLPNGILSLQKVLNLIYHRYEVRISPPSDYLSFPLNHLLEVHSEIGELFILMMANMEQ